VQHIKSGNWKSFPSRKFSFAYRVLRLCRQSKWGMNEGGKIRNGNFLFSLYLRPAYIGTYLCNASSYIAFTSGCFSPFPGNQRLAYPYCRTTRPHSKRTSYSSSLLYCQNNHIRKSLFNLRFCSATARHTARLKKVTFIHSSPGR
jgi:hypothetical protein